MKILLLTPHFYPETFKCNDMAFELQKRGHDVTVMTAIPDYPQGSFFKGYGIFKRRKEVIHEVKVHRSLIIPRGNGDSLRLALNYLSYTFFAVIKAIWFGFSKNFDAIIVHETSPVMVGIPAVLIKQLQKIPLCFWILDLWPESLFAAGGIRNKFVLKFFESLTCWIYKNCDTLLIGSKGFHKSIEPKGDFKNKIVYFPNWVDDIDPSNKAVPNFPDGFNIVFTGNIGDAQDFPHVIDVAKKLKNCKDINFFIIGDGRKKKWLDEQIRKNNLSNIKCLGRFPIEQMPEFYKKASVLFLALKNNLIFSLTAPAKLQAYMSSGKPVVAMINGEGADLISEADCGWSVPAEDSDALASLLLKLSKEDKEVLKKKGENGKAYSDQHFRFSDCIDNLESILHSGKRLDL